MFEIDFLVVDNFGVRFVEGFFCNNFVIIEMRKDFVLENLLEGV